MLRFLLAIAMPAAVFADAGYLGSVAQGPVPAGRESTHVRMVCQDVLIEVGENTYSITGDFLFASEADEGPVYMYFPLDVLTPFVGALYSAMEPEDLLRRVSVTVDGERAEVFALMVCEWDPAYMPPADWKRVVELLEPLSEERPEAGRPLYVRRMVGERELSGSPRGDDSAHPALRCQSVNAAWIAEAPPGDTVLVECVVTGNMSTDYFGERAILCYPLQTGSSWSGPIGRGRVTVVTADSIPMSSMVYTTGVMMPPESRPTPFQYMPLPQISRHPAFPGSRLARLEGRAYGGALVWSFRDFEPALAPTGWRALHPGLGDMYGLVADSVGSWRSGDIERRPAAWAGSYVYIYLSNDQPEGLSVISVDGLPLRRSPEEGAEALAVLPVSTGLNLLERRGSWLRVRARVDEPLGGGSAGERTGWVNLRRIGEEGLVLPSALPLL